MKPPVLIAAPATPVVALADLKTYLRVNHDHEDAKILALESAAVARLDGWTGVLGRCILEQQWRQDFAAWGTLRLCLPDVSAVSVSYIDASGLGQSISAPEIKTDARGWYVVADGPAAQEVRVTMTCALPDSLMPSAVLAIKVLVANAYLDREGMETDDALFRAINSICGHLRWMHSE